MLQLSISSVSTEEALCASCRTRSAHTLTTRIVVPLSRELVVDVGEVLQQLVLALVALARSFLVFGERLWDCTGGFEPRPRLCGALGNTTLGNATLNTDCGAAFVAADSSCYASGSHLRLDLVTPGLYMRAGARVLHCTVATRCDPAALMLNLAVFQLTDYQLYLSVQAMVNFVLQGAVLQWVQLARSCAFVKGLPIALAKMVGCSPDYGALFDLATTAMQSLGLTVDAWLNFAALQLSTALGGRQPTCNGESLESVGGVQLRLEDVFLDAGRAIEGSTIEESSTLTQILPFLNVTPSSIPSMVSEWSCCIQLSHSLIRSKHPGPCDHQLRSSRWWLPPLQIVISC